MNCRIKIALPVFNAARYANYVGALGRLGAEADIECDPSRCAGLLLPGGGDVNPGRYGRVRQPECEAPDDALDELQFDALDRFVRVGRPVLGVCRGHQLINVYFGGTLVQHLPQSARHSRCGLPEDKSHGTRAETGSFVQALYGYAFSVNSAHHQATDALGRGLAAVQWSDDGVVEALCHETLPIWAVQWHPERMCFEHAREDTVDGTALLKWFLDVCGQ